MAKTKTQKEAKLVKKNAQANIVLTRGASITKVAKVKKDAKIVSKKAEVKVAAPKTMRNRSGLHIINPRKPSAMVAGVAVKVAVVDVTGVAKGNMTLSPEIFGQTPNKNLVAQAVRVYLANQRQGTSSTKTRSDVTGSTRKIYRQKGTGRARHGAAKGPIFVGGGIVFGPHPQDYSLKFPKKMKKAALIYALSQKAQDGAIRVIDGDFSGKTKEIAKLMKIMDLNKKGIVNKALFVTDKNENSARAAHNLAGLKIESAATLSTYGVVICRYLIFMKSAVADVTERLTKKD